MHRTPGRTLVMSGRQNKSPADAAAEPSDVTLVIETAVTGCRCRPQALLMWSYYETASELILFKQDP